jgi:type IV secretory pathway VirB4 component
MTRKDYKYTFDTKRGKYIPTHRKIMEDFLKRDLTSNEIVHHKDRNKFNNNLENLEVMTREQHASLHHVDTKGIKRKKGYKPHNKISDEIVEKILILTEKGLNFVQIAKELKISNMTSRRYVLIKKEVLNAPRTD